jgi:hypothetical protein
MFGAARGSPWRTRIRCSTTATRSSPVPNEVGRHDSRIHKSELTLPVATHRHPAWSTSALVTSRQSTPRSSSRSNFDLQVVERGRRRALKGPPARRHPQKRWVDDPNPSERVAPSRRSGLHRINARTGCSGLVPSGRSQTKLASCHEGHHYVCVVGLEVLTAPTIRSVVAIA